MKSFVLCIAAASMLVACNPSKHQEADNVLTEQQKKEGWRMLFDGETMKGWRIYKNQENNSWEAKDGMLHCKPFEDRAENKRSDLITNEEFGNFELDLEWKISPQSNSGIIYRVTEGYDQPYLSGPEYQVLDDVGYPESVENWQKTAANYAMNEPVGVTPKPVGEWNTTRIIVKGNHVEHWLNGAKAVEYELGSDDWKVRKTKGKWKDAIGYGAAPKGHIDLQDHGNEVWFRNIMIKEI